MDAEKEAVLEVSERQIPPAAILEKLQGKGNTKEVYSLSFKLNPKYTHSCGVVDGRCCRNKPHRSKFETLDPQSTHVLRTYDVGSILTIIDY